MLKKIFIVLVVFGGGNEYMVFILEEIDGIIVVYNYFEEIDIFVNRDFLVCVDKMMGVFWFYINGIVIGGYIGLMIWVEVVKWVGSFDYVVLMDVFKIDIEWVGLSGKMVLEVKIWSII